MAVNYIGNNKHLTLDDRIRIEVLLEQKSNFSMIARELRKSSSTISKEILPKIYPTSATLPLVDCLLHPTRLK